MRYYNMHVPEIVYDIDQKYNLSQWSKITRSTWYREKCKSKFKVIKSKQ